MARYQNIILPWAIIATCLLIFQSFSNTSSNYAENTTSSLRQRVCPYTWHGGSPAFNGSCWCGHDAYCMCTPSLAIDAIMEVTQPSDSQVYIVLVRRRDIPRDKHAIVGGFVEIGESVENAVHREVREETNLEVTGLELFQMYSDPHRDLRRHTVSAVYRGHVEQSEIREHMKVGDDAKGVVVIKLSDALSLLDIAFDHAEILTDYARKFHPDLLRLVEENKALQKLGGA
jgi:8-oxo-dGTP diphosphatase